MIVPLLIKVVPVFKCFHVIPVFKCFHAILKVVLDCRKELISCQMIFVSFYFFNYIVYKHFLISY